MKPLLRRFSLFLPLPLLLVACFPETPSADLPAAGGSAGQGGASGGASGGAAGGAAGGSAGQGGSAGKGGQAGAGQAGAGAAGKGGSGAGAGGESGSSGQSGQGGLPAGQAGTGGADPGGTGGSGAGEAGAGGEGGAGAGGGAGGAEAGQGGAGAGGDAGQGGAGGPAGQGGAGQAGSGATGQGGAGQGGAQGGSGGAGQAGASAGGAGQAGGPGGAGQAGAGGSVDLCAGVVCVEQACQAAACNPATGRCDRPDGAACDNGDACDGTDACLAGICRPRQPLLIQDDFNGAPDAALWELVAGGSGPPAAAAGALALPPGGAILRTHEDLAPGSGAVRALADAALGGGTLTVATRASRDAGPSSYVGCRVTGASLDVVHDGGVVASSPHSLAGGERFVLEVFDDGGSVSCSLRGLGGGGLASASASPAGASEGAVVAFVQGADGEATLESLRVERSLPRPAHHWAFDEASGDFARDAVSNQDGARGAKAKWVQGAFGRGIQPTASACAHSSAACIDGTGVDFGAVGQFGKSGFTTSLWIKPATAGFRSLWGTRDTQGGGTWWQFRSVSGDNNGLSLGGSEGFAFSIVSNSSAGGSQATWLVDGAWHHLAMTRSGAKLRYYVDGRLAAEIVSSAVIDLSGAGKLYLGRENGLLTADSALMTFDGAADEARLYDSALDACQIRALAARPREQLRALPQPPQAGGTLAAPASCPHGQVLVGFQGRRSGAAISHLLPSCAALQIQGQQVTVGDPSGFLGETYPDVGYGDSKLGTPWQQSCAFGEAVTGVSFPAGVTNFVVHCAPVSASTLASGERSVEAGASKPLAGAGGPGSPDTQRACAPGELATGAAVDVQEGPARITSVGVTCSRFVF